MRCDLCVGSELERGGSSVTPLAPTEQKDVCDDTVNNRLCASLYSLLCLSQLRVCQNQLAACLGASAPHA